MPACCGRRSGGGGGGGGGGARGVSAATAAGASSFPPSDPVVNTESELRAYEARERERARKTAASSSGVSGRRDGCCRCPNAILALRYVHASTRREMRNFLIGVATVFIVVMFSTFLENVVLRSPIIFLKLAESQAGEMDLMLIPRVDNQTNTFFLNFTDVRERVGGVSAISGMAPRWILRGRITNTASANNISTTVSILIINSTLERDQGIGRSWRFRPLGSQEAYVTSQALREIGVDPRVGQSVTISVDAGFLGGGGLTAGLNVNDTTVNVDGVGQVLLPQELQDALNTNLPTLNNLATSQVVKVVDEIVLSDGKYGGLLGNVVVMEAEFAAAFVQPLVGLLQLSGTIPPANGRAFAMNEYCFQIIVMSRDRFSTYQKDGDGIDRDMLRFANQVVGLLGKDYPAEASLPLTAGIGSTLFIRLFLDNIFLAVIIVLVFLGCLLIYSLLIGDVEEKTYEYGMLRALGMRTNVLIILLFIQSLYYAIPGIIFAEIVTAVLNGLIAIVLGYVTQTGLDVGLSWQAVLIGLGAGFVMPLLSNIGPIKAALSKTLRDSLDVYHQSSSDSIVRFLKLETVGISPTEAILSILLVVYGFAVYYFVPLAFTFNQFPVFLLIFTLILLGMLLGLSFLGQMLQPFLELLMLKLMMWGTDRRLYPLVTKHLTGHRSRNRKTAIMFTTAMAFIIFAGAMFTLQAQSISDQLKALTGSDVVLAASSIDTPLPEADLRALIEKEVALGSASRILAHSFASFPLRSTEFVSTSRLNPLNSFPSTSNSFVGIEPTFLDATYTEYYVVTETNSRLAFATTAGKPDLMRSLYSNTGRVRLPFEPATGQLVPPPNLLTYVYRNVPELDANKTYNEYFDVVFTQSMKEAASLDVNVPLRLVVRVDVSSGANVDLSVLGKAHGVISKLPGFFISSYRLLASNSPVFMTMENMMRLQNRSVELSESSTAADSYLSSVSDVKKQTLYVKLRAGYADRVQREAVVQLLKTVITDDSITVTDTGTLLETTSTAVFLINMFFVIVAVIATVLAFFILWLSFTANIRENSWEFGVLRSLGLTAGQVVRSYVYEAMSLVMSSVLIGVATGILVAVTLTLQFNLFLEAPFTFIFPTELFVAVIVMGFIVAIVGSYFPAAAVVEREIALVLRGL